MLKQAIPPIVGGSHGNRSDNGGGSAFPPFNNLPQWTRVNTLARSFPPKPILKDRLNRLSESSSDPLKASIESADELSSPEVGILQQMANDNRQVRQLEHSIAYLKQQQDELLTSLHQEIDKLKRENRDLQFKLTMTDDHWNVFTKGGMLRQKSAIKTDSTENYMLSLVGESGNFAVSESAVAVSNSDTVKAAGRPRSSRRPGSRSKAETERQIHTLESEILELRDALREEKQRNTLLEEQLERLKSARGSDGPSSDGAASDVSTSTARATVLFAPRPPAQPRSIASVERLRRSSVTGVGQSVSAADAHVPTAAVGSELAAVRLSAAHQQQQQPLTVTECYDVIRKLQIDNSRQALELSQLKSDLRESIHSHKFVPNSIVLSKGTHSTDSDSQLRHQQYRTSQKSHSKKHPEALYNPQDLLSLPAVKMSLAQKAVDRHKRSQQALHRPRPENELITTNDVSENH